MLMKSSVGNISDNCGVFNVYIFHLYKGFNRKSSYYGDYVKVSVRDTKPNNWLTKKTKKKSLILRTVKGVVTSDGSYINYNSNSLILLKKRLTVEGESIVGPAIRTFKKKKFLASLSGVI